MKDNKLMLLIHINQEIIMEININNLKLHTDQLIMTILMENQNQVMIHTLIINAIQMLIVNMVNAAHNGVTVEQVNLILYKVKLIVIIMLILVTLKKSTLENVIMIMTVNQEIVKLKIF